MSSKKMCSVCLSSSDNVHLFTTTRLQYLYKRLASPSSNLYPGMLIQMCYLCRAAFLKIYKFIEVASKSYEKLKKWQHFHLQVPEAISNQEKSKIHNLSITTIPSITINEQSDQTSVCNNVIIKQEYIEPDEASSNITEKHSEKHENQTNINTNNNPTQIIKTVSPLTNKRISVTLSLPPNHKIKKMTNINVLNPVQNTPQKSLPFSQVVSKNQILLHPEKKRNSLQKCNTMFSMQSTSRHLLTKTSTRPSRPNKTKQVSPAAILNTSSPQAPMPIAMTNAIPALVPSTAPIKSIPPLAPISLPASLSLPVYTSIKPNNEMMISFTSSAPTPVPKNLPKLAPFTLIAPNPTLPADQTQKQKSVSKVLTDPSKCIPDESIPLYFWYNTAPSPAKKGKVIKERVIQAKHIAKNMPTVYLCNPNNNILPTQVKQKETSATSKPVEPIDSMITNITNSSIIGNSSSDANKINEKVEPKLNQSMHNTGVMNFVKIAPKPGLNNSMPGFAEASDKAKAKEVPTLEKNKNLDTFCKIEEDIDMKIWIEEEEVQQNLSHKYLLTET